MRDLWVTAVPARLHAQIYAVAARRRRIGMPSSVATTVGALLCFGLRFMALWRGWRLPAAASRSHPYACAHPAAATLRPGLTWHYRRG